MTTQARKHTNNGKRKRIASIPVTSKMAKLIDATPADRELILVSATGRQLTEEHASKSVKAWARKAAIRDELRLYDARGTAATRLLHANLSLNQIAVHMGWSLRHAANVIENYAAASGGDADEILTLLEGSQDEK